MLLDAFIAQARSQGASDVHLEPGLPPAFRIDGALRVQGEPVTGQTLVEAAREVVGEDNWAFFLQRRSFDLSLPIAGTRCRINVLHSSRGVGLAIRLLAAFAATLERLNLHPDLGRLAHLPHGLVVVSGPTGCGKSTTLAALIQEINLSDARHIVTLESPIEYVFKPRRAFIRQREVGRDTPSFDQGLLDALREDPDVLMVGEMREPETMRLTLNASETGHLVFATVHSSSTIDALQRLVASFSPEIQASVRAALADCLQTVVCQRLRYRPDLKIRIPECEVLVATHAVRNFIRIGEMFRINPMIETGADHGMWTFARYQRWLESRRDWALPGPDDPPDADPDPIRPAVPARSVDPMAPARVPGPVPAPATPSLPAASLAKPGKTSSPIEIVPEEGGLAEVLKRLAK
jgi:twitching motility protein PilT